MNIIKTGLGLLTAGIFGLAILHSFDVPQAGHQLQTFSRFFFGPLAPFSLLYSMSIAAMTFVQIVRRYRKISGFPWLPSLGFAMAAMTAIIALHALLSS
jgi:hypothetical protein